MMIGQLYWEKIDMIGTLNDWRLRSEDCNKEHKSENKAAWNITIYMICIQPTTITLSVLINTLFLMQDNL